MKNKMGAETTIVQYNDPAYGELVNHITDLWANAKADAITAVNTHLLDANWKTGQYIVEFEQKGQARDEYGKPTFQSGLSILSLHTEMLCLDRLEAR